MSKANVIAWIAVILLISTQSFLFGVEMSDRIDPPPYESCQEDEVFDWSHNGGDYPDDIEWSCVPFDDLIEMNRVEE